MRASFGRPTHCARCVCGCERAHAAAGALRGTVANVAPRSQYHASNLCDGHIGRYKQLFAWLDFEDVPQDAQAYRQRILLKQREEDTFLNVIPRVVSNVSRDPALLEGLRKLKGIKNYCEFQYSFLNGPPLFLLVRLPSCS